ncbi:MAG: alpha/beta fold hydrolase [Anaerolineales bacterium]|nr:alpha/beta fold hydrolase [Anaerolineales bacterium]
MLERSWRFTALNLMLIFLLIAGVIYVPRLLIPFNPLGLLLLAALVYGMTAMNRARNVFNPQRFPLMRTDPGELGLPPFEEVTFQSLDGIELSGWYIPSKNRAVIVMVHSVGGSRVQMRHYARALVDSGYGILLFDLRAHARSEGSVSTFGWLEPNDLLGAVKYLQTRAEIDPQRIGVLGVSLGAQIALRGAALSPDIRAVWADGPIPVVFRDHVGEAASLRQVLLTPWWGLAYRVQEWLTGLRQPAPLVEVIAQISPRPVFVVACGNARLIQVARKYFEAAKDPKWWWQLDDIPFASGILEKGDDYDFKLIGFFNKAL